jgi:hypothetical protein
MAGIGLDHASLPPGGVRTATCDRPVFSAYRARQAPEHRPSASGKDAFEGNAGELGASAAEEGTVGQRATALARRQDVGAEVHEAGVVEGTGASSAEESAVGAIVLAVPAHGEWADVALLRVAQIDDSIATERTVGPALRLTGDGVGRQVRRIAGLTGVDNAVAADLRPDRRRQRDQRADQHDPYDSSPASQGFTSCAVRQSTSTDRPSSAFAREAPCS